MNGKIRYFSMFTGVGGFEVGIQNAGLIQQEGPGPLPDSDRTPSQYYTCVGFSEIDRYASELLAKKFPSVKNYGDATKINTDELPDFDILCGGFPCQTFSIAGKRRGFSDVRGTMFFEIVRILKAKRPKFTLLENVKGLLSHNEGQTFQTILNALQELGYDAQWMVLNSKFFGVPQNRERVFIIGSLTGESRPEILPFERSDTNTNEEDSKTCRTLRAGYFKGSSETHIERADKGNHYAYRVYSEGGIAPTLRNNMANDYHHGVNIVLNEKTRDVQKAIQVAQEISMQENKPVQLDLYHLQHVEIRPLSTYIPQNLDEHRCLQGGEPKEVLVQGMKIRRLTPIECERLQGFPDNWTEGFSDTQRYKMMGNAVTTKVIKAIMQKLRVENAN